VRSRDIRTQCPQFTTSILTLPQPAPKLHHGRCIHWIMDTDDSVNEWSSDDESDRQPSNDSRHHIQPARGARLPQQSQRRPVNRTLSFVPYADWSPDQVYEDLPPSYIHYFIEWKLTVNRRIIAKQTENDLVVAPSDF
jgi:hypothetical protein